MINISCLTVMDDGGEFQEDVSQTQLMYERYYAKQAAVKPELLLEVTHCALCSSC